MSFIDRVEVSLIAGKGGDGHRSFRRERYVDKGGPDGGDGGQGGSIIFEASNSQDTLMAFRYERELKADNGIDGSKSKKRGRSGSDLIVKVPVGTQVINDSSAIIADLTIDQQKEVIATGGKGGYGNAHFVSSSRQAPNFAEKGEEGEKLHLTLELKLIADVGLVGLPNAGKSTLLSRLSNARPEIADYPFTTIVPNLGVVDIDGGSSFLIADIPGLIEGAALGKGLGHKFLRHIERTKLIVHLIDIYQPDIASSYKVIRSELSAYSKSLAKLPEIVAVNKIDGLDDISLDQVKTKLSPILPHKAKILFISAQAGTNLDELKYTIVNSLKVIKRPKKKAVAKHLPVIKLADTSRAFTLTKSKDGYIIRGMQIGRFARRTDFSNSEATHRLMVIMKRHGIMHELIRQGLKAGDRLQFGPGNDTGFIYYP